MSHIIIYINKELKDISQDSLELQNYLSAESNENMFCFKELLQERLFKKFLLRHWSDNCYDLVYGSQYVFLIILNEDECE